MPLTPHDRAFLRRIDYFKAYLLLMAGAVLLYVLFMPVSERQMATSVIGVALCGVFWITQRLLTVISNLDLEITRLTNAIARSLPESQRKELLGSPR